MMKARLRLALCLLWLAICFTAQAAATGASPAERGPDVASVIAHFRASIPKLMEEKKVPGLAVAVVTGRRVLWQEGFGSTDDDRRVPVTAETPFSVQSMSKNFTAAAVLAAVRDGLVALDTPITAYLPEFTVNSRFEDRPERKMTLRLLLSHRAGFTHEAPDGNNFDPGSGSFANHVRSISRTWLRFPVDQRYGYSNLGVDLAGYILEVRSGLPFAEYVRRKVLDPVGMKGSTFDIEAVKRDARRAVGHIPFRTPVPVEVPMVPAGGLYASAADLARYVQFHLNEGRAAGRRVLPKKLLAEMAAIPARDPRQTKGYGLGLAVVPQGGTVLLTHSGGGFGFLTYMGWLPEIGVGVVCLTNATGHNLNTSIGGELLEKFLAAGAGAKPVPPGADPGAQTLPPEIDPPSAEQARLAGQYLYASGGWMNVELKDGRIGVTSGGEFRAGRFISPDEVVFMTGGVPFFYRFVRKPDGAPACLVRLYDGETLDFHTGPDDPPSPDKAEWEGFVGRYRYKINGLPGGSFRIAKKNGYLYLDHMRLFEHRPGLFFAVHGEALDFTGPFPTWRNIRLEKPAAN